ncbi:MAG: hypothetical protein JW838_01360 [Spirochaetes bacterium]|nr:hypothetical protein [Spirochaetota bacterium]
MKRLRVIALMLAIGGSMVLGGCDGGEKDNNELLLLLSSSSNQGTISLFVDGTLMSMKSYNGFIWDSGQNRYVVQFGDDHGFLIKSITIAIPCAKPMTAPQPFNELSPDFLFFFMHNGGAYGPEEVSGFDFTIDSVSGGKASGTFSGTLDTSMDGVPPEIVITDGTFTDVVIH